MTNPKKILALGIGQSNFLNQLYGDLIRKGAPILVDIDGYFDIANDGDDSIYRKHIDLKAQTLGTFQLYKSLLEFMRTSFFWQILYFELSQRKSLGDIKRILFSYSWSKYIAENVLAKADYDVFHFHYCTPENLKLVHFLPTNRKVICSFWGSDLMRNPGVANVFYVGKALWKASAITIQTRELAEMLYCKFGRNFADKTQIVQFTIHTGIYENIDLFTEDLSRIGDFKRANGIPADRVVICVGHNAFNENNHVQILQALQNMPDEVKSQICVILPLGYGRQEAYLRHLETIVSQIESFPVVMLHDYFGPEDTALLRIVSEIMIQMPVSDALSGAMTEAMYAGNHVIAASWLPYGLLKRNGIAFAEAEDFDKLPKAVSQYLESPSSFRQSNRANREKIKASLFPEKTTADWRKILESL